MIGGPGLSTYQKREPNGAPIALGALNNGISVDPLTAIGVLGQAVGEAGDPAQLLSAREIPMFSFPLTFRGQTTANGVNRTEIVDGATLNIFGDTALGPGFPAPAIVLTDFANANAFIEIGQLLDVGLLQPLSVFRNAQVGLYLYPSGQAAISPVQYAAAPPAQYSFEVTGNSRLNGNTVTGKFTDIASASPVAIGPDVSRTQFGNFAAGLKEFLLPAAAPGLNYGFYVGHTDGVLITPNVTNTIRITGTLGAVGASATSTTVGDYIELSCINGGEWFASVVTGAGWTV